MFKRIFQLFKIARKLSTSGAIDTINQIYTLPVTINIFFNLISIGSEKKLVNNQKNPEKNFVWRLRAWAPLLSNSANF